MEFTQEQLDAINAKGRVIVSASAGSGKTTVMIEKIIRLIKSGASVKELLAVTFTKKAAAQMKEKLSKALIKAINAPTSTEDERKRLKEQLVEVPNADISTIHSFCAKLIRANFFALGVDNAFRVIGGDDAEGAALKGEALNQLLEEGYASDDEDFKHLLSCYWRKKSDKALRKAIVETYGSLRDRADYKEYLERSKKYDENTFKAICADLQDLFFTKCRYYLDLVENENMYFSGVGMNQHCKLCQELCDWLEAFLHESGYFNLPSIPKPAKFTTNAAKGYSGDKKAHIERLGFLKDRIVDLHKKEVLTIGKEDEELEAFMRSARTASAIATYLLKFDEKYEALKLEKGVLDYNDLEHKALELLSMPEMAASIREKYRYVFVDEYQDVNPVQEAIVTALSGDNVFLVGDVKQSIYGFRGSKSKFFVEKQARYKAGEGQSLKMKSNFRSSDKVLDAVNTQFTLAMTLQNSSVDYKEESIMEKGGSYPINSGKVQIHFLGKEEEEKTKRGVYSVMEHADVKASSTASNAARMIHQIIDQELKEKFYNPDKKVDKEPEDITIEDREERVRYSDIAILSRKKQGQIEETVASLSALGIPVSAAVAVNVCEFAEVKTLIDILQLLDNAEQDIPLCSALLSAMGDMTLDMVAGIRLAYKDDETVKTFRAACKRYAAEKKDLTEKKLNDFYAYFEEIRALSRVLSAGEILNRILGETQMEVKLLSAVNGVESLKRVRRFIEETYNPEPLSVHEFLDKLRDLDYEINYCENGGEESVKVMTMHASKGLEFPVVILDNLGQDFRGADHDEVLVEEKYGLAPRSFNEKRITKDPTVLRRLYAIKEVQDSIADELNLYYVALTRAKHTLHMIFDEATPMADVKYAKSFAEFTDFSVWDGYKLEEELQELQPLDKQGLVMDGDESLKKKIVKEIKKEYPYAGYEDLPVKSSATQLLDDYNGEKTVAVPIEETEEPKLDDSEMEAEVKDVGTAYHAFLERFDFSLLYDETGAPIDKASLEERVENVLATEKDGLQVALLDKAQLVSILSNPIFYELLGTTLYKEQQFLVSLPVKDTYAKKTGVSELIVGRNDGEEMIFQGAIDLLSVGDGKARIIDYKYSSHGKDYLRTHYKPQLDLYKKAVAKILPIKEENIHCSIVNIRYGFQVDMD
ncbi:MAG: UvrD-helicase domain-containing protein [Clostridia bacterium]|nr:UvrD-helicase domain-containing protein [Clostridia bacterium]